MDDSQDKLLFTPGPLMTSQSVKNAALKDIGSRDAVLMRTVADIRHRLLNTANASKQEGFESILLQGPGTFAVEAVFDSLVPHDCKLLVLVNGQYSSRMMRIAQMHRSNVCAAILEDNQRFDASFVDRCLRERNGITHVAVVHCETGTGLLNSVGEIGPVVRAHGAQFIVDAMSTFGGVPIDMNADCIDCLISSANKCVQGIPGVAFILTTREILGTAQGLASTMSFDLRAQWDSLEEDGQFRFTPPTHVLLALSQALIELSEEGGVNARARRYARNHEILVEGMQLLGFRPYIDPPARSYIVTLFQLNGSHAVSFEQLYAGLSARGFIIYRGPQSHSSWFRIATIGHVFEEDIRRLVMSFSKVVSRGPEESAK